MFIFAQLLGVFITAAGLAVLLRPQVALTMVAFWEKEQRIYTAGIIRLLFGGILVLSAPDAIIPVTVFLLGILFLISGLLIYVLPEVKIRGMLAWFKARPPIVVRIWGCIACLIGLLLLFSV